MAQKSKIKEQNIAVFGEPGSGKTVLLSSLYGATQEPAFRGDSLYKVVADDVGQGTRLLQNYLKMRKDAQAPPKTRFASTSYSFTIKPKKDNNAEAAKRTPFSALRFIWHDYPGEWFTEDPSSHEEARRRIETFTTLLKSDVALILVDGQKLLDYAGEEEKYLKSLLRGLGAGLQALQDDILPDGQPLEEFPRIWVLALSKADLLPDLDVHEFQSLIIHKAADEVAALSDTLKEFVQVPEALSLGEDFLVLSSAKFEPGKIDVTTRRGLDLILPVASLLPLERLGQWFDKLDVPLKVLGKLVDNADTLAVVLAGAGAGVVGKLLGKVPKVGKILGPVAVPALAEAAQFSAAKLRETHSQALENRDYATAMLTEFRLDLDRGVDEGLLSKCQW